MCEDLEFWGYLATFGTWGFIPKILFVSDGAIVEADQGWYAKHRLRWQSSPTVEQWESRIVGRLRNEDWPGFRVVRGRIAKMAAHAKVLAGQDAEALEIVRKHAGAFPRDRISRAMKLGSATAPMGWKALCRLLRFREWLKAVLLGLTVSTRSPKAPPPV